ncbi:MAG: signal recognition particle protein, partial [Azorhizobium sp. 35-67-5]
QLNQMQKLGGMNGLMGLLPGVGKIKNQIAAANIDDKVFKRQVAIISSMTRQERRNPKVLDASRKRRVAAGSGTKVEEINRLLKMHRQMADMMKAMGGAAGKRGPMAGLANMFGMGGGMPSPEQIQQMADKMPGGLPGAGGGLPPTMPGLGKGMPPGLPPTFPGGLPGLPRGLPGFGKKK